MKTIMHVDMNAFFAAVEQQSNPALRGRPVAVTGSEKRSIILSLNRSQTVGLSMSAGFLALFGIATDDGVVMATYLDQSFAKHKPTTREAVRAAVVEAGARRIVAGPGRRWFASLFHGSTSETRRFGCCGCLCSGG